jgi:hypothetical protein
MKKPFIKQTLYGLMLVAGMNLVSSCDSCNRDKDSNDTTTGGTMTGHDSTSTAEGSGVPSDEYGTGTTVGRNNSGASGSGSGTTSGAGSSGSSGSASGSGNNNESDKGTPNNSASNNTSGTKSVNDPDNDPAENSNYYRNKKAGNINSGGSAGTGSGTGTGTTGNNSRVSDPRDQAN